MIAPGVTLDEDSRLATLMSLGILDTQAEQRFDRVTRTAQRLFDVPIALVSLVDSNRQWFKSRVGLDAKETPRDISFCGHAILGNDVFVVPDTARDARFADNPLVLDSPHIRFYAGCPLLSSNGSKLGTLCIIDTKPRQFGRLDLLALTDLAHMVESELVALELASVDELTQMPNRRSFMALAQHSLNVAYRESIPATLAYFDLNGFKRINDSFGHEEGDRALMAFARAMKSGFRLTDLVARMGGDEFVALFLHATLQDTTAMLQKFRQSLHSYNMASEGNYDIQYSQGVVAADPAAHSQLEKLIAEADAVMYQEKKPSHQSGH